MTVVDQIMSTLLTKQEGEELIRNLETAKSPQKLPSLAKAKLKQRGKGINPQELAEEFKRSFYQKPFVKLEIAFDPQVDFLKKVRDYFSQNLGKEVIIDLLVDPQIIGGAKITCNEHYRDYSLASKLDDSQLSTLI